MATQTKAGKANADQAVQGGTNAIVGDKGVELAQTGQDTRQADGVSQGAATQTGQGGEFPAPGLHRYVGTDDQSTAGSVQVLRVIAKRDGFRRAGREWHGTTDVLLADLSEAQFKQLQDEPMLATMLLEMPDEQAYDLVDR